MALVLGYFMEENGIPIAPFVLGIVVGPLVDEIRRIVDCIFRSNHCRSSRRHHAAYLGIANYRNAQATEFEVTPGVTLAINRPIRLQVLPRWQ
ncbi:hypothetical protein AJ87_41450 [Rhizobium yanglingense]|nr:hypothetical protein AJ87_41450 [Rhizobium yanglingense]